MKLQRIAPARGNRPHITQMMSETLAQLGREFVVGQSENASRFAVGLGPYQRGTIACHWQNRERPGCEKLLIGDAIMRTLVADRGHNAGLAVIPSNGRDPLRFA